MIGTNAQPVTGGIEPVNLIGLPQCGQEINPFVSPILSLLPPQNGVYQLAGRHEKTSKPETCCQANDRARQEYRGTAALKCQCIYTEGGNPTERARRNAIIAAKARRLCFLLARIRQILVTGMWTAAR
jgi:hypothetical protein